MTVHSVFLMDDHPVVLRGLAELVGMEADFRIAGATTDGAGAFAMIESLKPDIAVLDVNVPDVSGLALLRQLRANDLPVRPIFLTAMITPAQASEAVENGIWGILLKESAPDTLIDCLRSVAAGRRWLSGEMERMAGAAHGLSALTPREMEIAGHACRGLSNKLIARELGASEGTVKIHLHNIFQKLRITNRTALAAIYYERRAEAYGEAPKG